MAEARVIYKVLTHASWHAMQQTGKFEGSEDDKRDGFIHLSTAVQLPGTLSKHFSGQRDLFLLAIDAARFDENDTLKWERSRDQQLFPHLYQPLSLSSVHDARPLPDAHDARLLFCTNLNSTQVKAS